MSPSSDCSCVTVKAECKLMFGKLVSPHFVLSNELTNTKKEPGKYRLTVFFPPNKLTSADASIFWLHSRLFLLEVFFFLHLLFTKKQWSFFPIYFLQPSSPSPSKNIGFKLIQLHMVSFTCLARHTEAQAGVQDVKMFVNANSGLMMISTRQFNAASASTSSSLNASLSFMEFSMLRNKIRLWTQCFVSRSRQCMQQVAYW